jgi:hypothetical protein
MIVGINTENLCDDEDSNLWNLIDELRTRSRGHGSISTGLDALVRSENPTLIAVGIGALAFCVEKDSDCASWAEVSALLSNNAAYIASEDSGVFLSFCHFVCALSKSSSVPNCLDVYKSLETRLRLEVARGPSLERDTLVGTIAILVGHVMGDKFPIDPGFTLIVQAMPLSMGFMYYGDIFLLMSSVFHRLSEEVQRESMRAVVSFLAQPHEAIMEMELNEIILNSVMKLVQKYLQEHGSAVVMEFLGNDGERCQVFEATWGVLQEMVGSSMARMLGMR